MKNTRRTFLKQSAGSVAALSITPVSLGAPTRSGSERIFRFAVASDGHFGQPNTPYQDYHRRIVQALNEEKERSGLDVCFFNGDLIHDDPKFMPDVKTAFSGLTMPHYVTRGNHDRLAPGEWQRIWGYPEDHLIEMGEVAFVLGNTSNQKGEYVCADTRWLKQALDRSRRKKHVFVLLHISQRKWTKHGIDCPDVMNLIESYSNVKAIFHGHDHDEDGAKTSGGKPYLYDGHFGGNWGTAYRGYRIVEIFADGRISTWQFNPEVAPIVNVQVLK